MTNGRRLQLFTSVAALFLVGPAHAGERLLYGPGGPSTEMATQAETVLRIAADVKAPSWGHDYPPDPQALFDEARTELVAATAPTVAVDLGGGQVTDFRVDGEVLDVGTAHALHLYRGKHLIQYTGADGINISNLVNRWVGPAVSTRSTSCCSPRTPSAARTSSS